SVGCNDSGSSNFDLVVFHTNDRHSHLLGIPNGDYDSSTTGDGTVGGAARWVKIVEDTRASNPEVLLFSAGDFTMGTMLVAAENNAADLNFMKEVGYAAAALGNHELDWGPARLAEMINAADQPPIPLLAANIRFSDTDPADDSLAALYGDQGEAGKAIFPYITLTTPAGTKVGVFGLLGVEATSVSNAAPLLFSRDVAEMAQTSQAIVNTLRVDEEVDLVVCLAHLGIEMVGQTPTSETIELAQKTQGIDLILSGHNHTVMQEAVSIDWTTVTMEAGSYGRFLGRYDIVQKGDNKTISSQLITIDDSLVTLEAINNIVADLIVDIETNFLPLYPVVPDAGAFLTSAFFQALTHSSFDLPRINYECNNLGYLAADAMREVAQTNIAAVSNGGDLRQSVAVTKGDEVNLQDAFIATPLGTGPDKNLGYPLVKFYITLMELKLLIEQTTCDWGQTNNDYMIILSGLRFVSNTSYTTYNKIIKITLYQNEDESDPGTVLFDTNNGGFLVDNTTLYSICTSSYIADKMEGFNVYPKDSSGNRIENREDIIVKDNENREVKLWYTVSQKLAASDPVSNLYADTYPPNSAGPYWRRCWDLDKHECEGHPYCQ
ncbi:MAG: 5'-nucleotidase C-terminal domain-containing protein, partial [Deltaproteobacteria bacterium]|nr:5'-nucleotidase C-terminal domain-containing protein [Deltaproteobacteria bacterium]